MVSGLLALLELFALAVIPCLLTLLLTGDEVAVRWLRFIGAPIGRLIEWRRERRYRRRQCAGGAAAKVTEVPAGPPIEQLAADLRRLYRQRTGVATRSPVWFEAVSRAYDERLYLICRELSIAEHLHELRGIDLEIERVRVEGMLLQAGFCLPGTVADRRQDQR